MHGYQAYSSLATQCNGQFIYTSFILWAAGRHWLSTDVVNVAAHILWH